jgi:hypothetical protein
VKEGCSVHAGVYDDAPRLAFRIDHLLGARADTMPLRRRLGGSCPVPSAEIVGELPDALSALFRDEDRDLAQPLRSQGLGWGPALAHQRAAADEPGTSLRADRTAQTRRGVRANGPRRKRAETRISAASERS